MNSKPKISPHDDETWILTDDFTISVNGFTIKILSGFVFDAASIPRAAWSFVGSSSDPDFIIASLVHDALYVSQKLPRTTADDMFYTLLKRDGVSSMRAYIMYKAVDLFGYSAYDSGAKAEYIDKVLINKITGRECRRS